jgi:hypothetical protein
MNCPICGNTFNPYTAGKPKTYCSDDCRNYFKYKNALEKILLTLKPTREAKKVIKGDMFRLSNLLPNGTNCSSNKKEL